MSARTARLGEVSQLTLGDIAANSKPGEWVEDFWCPARSAWYARYANQRRVVNALVERGLLERGIQENWGKYRLTLDAWVYARKHGWLDEVEQA